MKTPANNVLSGKAAGDIRRHNRFVVLELVRTQGPISRAALARVGRLSMPAIMDIVGLLIEEGLVREVGVGPSSGGRRPVLLEVVPEAYCAVGLEVGARTIRAVVTDLLAVVRQRVQVPSNMAHGPDALLLQLRSVLHDILTKHTLEFGAILGVALALPAPILQSTAQSFSPPSYPDWGELKLGEWVAAHFDVPVIVENDAKAAALGESLYGAGRGVHNLFCVMAHRGIGGAAIVNGQLLRGADGGAGEIGHMLIDPNGPQCGCGRYGCLEAFAGRAAIAQRTVRALKLGGYSDLNGCALADVSTEQVIEAGLAGHAVAREVLAETGRYLGIGVANIINLFNPELVVVGGATMQAGDLVLDSLVRVARQRTLPDLSDQVRIVPSELGQDAGAVGAAALVLRELFVQGLRLH
jgi:predicted NBD/HSP70 family sugar kinase